MNFVVLEHLLINLRVKKLLHHDISGKFEGTAPFAETLCSLERSVSEASHNDWESYTLEDAVIGLHCPLSRIVDGVPDGL